MLGKFNYDKNDLGFIKLFFNSFNKGEALSSEHYAYLIGSNAHLNIFRDKNSQVSPSTILARKAANARHADRQTKYAMALHTVELNLEQNCHPEWEHIDYVNYILKKPEFLQLSRHTLKTEICKIFKNHNLHERIAKGKARHVK